MPDVANQYDASTQASTVSPVQKKLPADKNETSKDCTNGVCQVNWKPTRPAA